MTVTGSVRAPELAPVRAGRGARLAVARALPAGARSTASTATWTCSSSRTARPTSPTSCASATAGFVVRRPPFGQIAPGAHDMKREYRTLSRLWRAYAPAPRAFAFCDDHCRHRLRLPRDRLPARRRRLGRRPAVDGGPRRRRDGGSGLAVVDALGRLAPRRSATRSTSPTSAARTDSSSGRWRGWKQRWDLAALPDSPTRDAGGRRPAGGDDADVAVRVDPPQRLQARQLPVRPGRPRPGEVGVRLGPGDPRRPVRRRRHHC